MREFLKVFRGGKRENWGWWEGGTTGEVLRIDVLCCEAEWFIATVLKGHNNQYGISRKAYFAFPPNPYHC
jgi:hypothetical protein